MPPTNACEPRTLPIGATAAVVCGNVMCCASLCDAWGSFMERRENVKRVPLGPLCVVGYSCAQAMAGRPGCDAISGHFRSI